MPNGVNGNILFNSYRFNGGNSYRSDVQGQTNGFADSNGKLGFDCSGLVNYLLNHGGYNIGPQAGTRDTVSAPGTLTTTGAKWQSIVTANNARPGDLVYFDGHVGVVVSFNADTGHGVFRSSTSSRGVVDAEFSTSPVQGMTWGYTKHFWAFTRVTASYDQSRDKWANTYNTVVPEIEPGQHQPDAWWARLAQIESSNRADLVNAGGYMGLYQMGPKSSLAALGYTDAQGNWLNKDGVTRSDFLKNVNGIQDKAARDYLPILKGELQKNGAWDYIGKTFGEILVTEEGLLAAGWNMGANATKLELIKATSDGLTLNRQLYYRLDGFRGLAVDGKTTSIQDAHPSNPVEVHLKEVLRDPYISEGKLIANKDGSTMFALVVSEEIAKHYPKLHVGDSYATYFNKDGQRVGSSVLHVDGSAEWDSRDLATGHESYGASDASGFIIYSYTIDPNTHAIIGDYTVKGIDYNADGTPKSGQGPAASTTIDPAQLQDALLPPVALSEVLSTVAPTLAQHFGLEKLDAGALSSAVGFTVPAGAFDTGDSIAALLRSKGYTVVHDSEGITATNADTQIIITDHHMEVINATQCKVLNANPDGVTLHNSQDSNGQTTETYVSMTFTGTVTSSAALVIKDDGSGSIAYGNGSATSYGSGRLDDEDGVIQLTTRNANGSLLQTVFSEDGQEQTLFDSAGVLQRIDDYSIGHVQSDFSTYSNGLLASHGEFNLAGIPTFLATFDAGGHRTSLETFDAKGLEASMATFDSAGHQLSLATFAPGFMGLDQTGYVTTNAAGVTTGVETFRWGHETGYTHYDDAGVKTSVDVITATGWTTETFASNGVENGFHIFSTAGIELGYSSFNDAGQETSRVTLDTAGKMNSLETFNPANHVDTDLKTFKNGILATDETFDAQGREKTFATFDSAGVQATLATFTVGALGVKESTLATLDPHGATVTLETFNLFGLTASVGHFDPNGHETTRDLFSGDLFTGVFKSAVESFDANGVENGLLTYDRAGVQIGYGLFNGLGQQTAQVAIDPHGQILSQTDYNPATHVAVDLKQFTDGKLATVEGFNSAGKEISLATYAPDGHETTFASYTPGSGESVINTLATLNAAGTTIALETFTFGVVSTLAHFDDSGHETSIDKYSWGGVKDHTDLFNLSGVQNGLINYDRNGVETSYGSFNSLGQETSLTNVSPDGHVQAVTDYNPANHIITDIKGYNSSGAQISLELMDGNGVEKSFATFDPLQGYQTSLETFIPGYQAPQPTSLATFNAAGVTTSLELFSWGQETSMTRFSDTGAKLSVDRFTDGYKSSTETFGASGLETGLFNFNKAGVTISYGNFNDQGQETSLIGVDAAGHMISLEDFNPVNHIPLDLKTFTPAGVIQTLETFDSTGLEKSMATFDANGIQNTLETFVKGYAGLQEASFATLNPTGYTTSLETFTFGQEATMSYFNDVGQPVSRDIFNFNYKSATETYGSNGLLNGLTNFNSAGTIVSYGTFNSAGQETSLVGVDGAGHMISREDFNPATHIDVDLKLFKDGKLISLETFNSAGVESGLITYDLLGGYKTSEAVFVPGQNGPLETSLATFDANGVTRSYETFTLGQPATLAQYDASGHETSLDTFAWGVRTRTDNFNSAGLETSQVNYRNGIVESYGDYNAAGQQIDLRTVDASGRLTSQTDFNPANHIPVDVKTYNQQGAQTSIEGFDSKGFESWFETFDPATGAETSYATFLPVNGRVVEVSLATLNPAGYTVGLEKWDNNGTETSMARFDDHGQRTSLETFYWGGKTVEQYGANGLETALVNYLSGIEVSYGTFNNAGQQTSLMNVTPAGVVTSQLDYDPATHTKTDLKLFNNGVLSGIETFNSAGAETSFATFDAAGHETTLATFAPGLGTASVEVSLATLNQAGYTTSLEQFSAGQEVSMTYFNEVGRKLSMDSFSYGSKSSTETYDANGCTNGKSFFLMGQKSAYETFDSQGRVTSHVMLDTGTGQAVNEVDFDPLTHAQTDCKTFINGVMRTWETFSGGLEATMETFGANGLELSMSTFAPKAGGGVVQTGQCNFNSSGQMINQQFFSQGSVVGQEDFDPLTHAEINVSGIVHFDNTTLQVAAGSTVRIEGSGNTVNAAAGSSVTLGGNGVNGAVDTINCSNAKVSLIDDSRVVINGNADSITCGLRDNVTASGSALVVNNASAGDLITIGGNGMAAAVANVVNGSGTTVQIADNARTDVVGNNNSVLAGSADQVAIHGGGNVVSANSGDTIVLGLITILNKTANTVNASGVSVTLESGSDVKLNGSGDQVNLATGAALLANGGGNTIASSGIVRVEVTNTAGNADTIVSNGSVIGGSAGNNQTPGIILGANCEANITGSSNAIWLGTGDCLTAMGGANQITANGNDRIVIGNTGVVRDSISATGVLTGGLTANGQGTGIFLNDGARASIGGSNCTIEESGHNWLDVCGTGLTVNANGSSDFNNVWGNNDTVNVCAPGSVTNTFGQNDRTNVTANSCITDNYGQGNVSTNAGDHDRTNNFGSYEVNHNIGTNDICLNIGSSNTSDNGGVASNRTYSNSELSSIWYPMMQVPQPDPQFSLHQIIDNIASFLNDLFGPGLAGSMDSVAALVQQNQQAIAQGTWDTSGTLSAAVAANEMQQVQQVLASGAPSTLTGIRWEQPVLRWSLADHGSEFSSYLGADALPYVQKAFAAWGAACGLKFEQVADGASADIRVGNGLFNTASTGLVGTTMASGLPGQVLPGVLVMVEDSTQLPLLAGADGELHYAGTDTGFEQVLLHEIGHALGLGVNADPASIECFALSAANRSLCASDIAAIQALYGKPEAPLAELVGLSTGHG